MEKAQHRIAELESDIQARMEPDPTLTSLTLEIETVRVEVEAQKVITDKAKRARERAELKIERLHSEPRQFSDREANIRAKARKAIKALQEKLDVETAVHK